MRYSDYFQEFTPDKLYAQVMDLWDDYHRSCEAFDRANLTGPYDARFGGVMPANYAERALMNRNANDQYLIFKQKARALGATPEIIAAVKRAYNPSYIRP